MARLILLLLLPLLGAAQEASLKQAGVCSRCHVVQVLEWSASGHPKAATTCQGCHGASDGHVANERNQVKPDRLPRGEAIAGLCATCHTPGCPKTGQKANCQSCHHPHALANPDDRRLKPAESAEDKVFAEYRRHMADGEAAVSAGQWRGARDAFAEALRVRPADRRAAMRLRMTERRLKPGVAGFETIGEEYDAASGLPLRVRVAGLGFAMRLLPGGDFDMGSESLRASQPQHTVHVEPFYLATEEVSQKLWNQLMSENPSVHKGDALPVNNVSWEDAGKAVEQLNARVVGGGFRLPTEAEWEYAARGGEQKLAEAAWYRDNAAVAGETNGFREMDGYAPRAVGTRQANRWGLYDLLGNVAEWCSSLIRPYPYDAGDGRESATDTGLRVIRGGAYADSAGSLDAALRHSERPSRRLPWNGMRVARSVPER
ncbi:MAG: SUMF1/EgtB/PvdO family nonheme iron enzyme [Bryobacterales bacterium]|nr:SUMF1/EgtB/PvdO family nonheme iron enzyme [Bryobacterales bacterium]